MREIEDLHEIIERLSQRIETLENDRRIIGPALGIMIVAVIYLLFWGN